MIRGCRAAGGCDWECVVVDEVERAVDGLLVSVGKQRLARRGATDFEGVNFSCLTRGVQNID